MKKILSLLLVFSMIFAVAAFAGCNNTTTKDDKSTDKTDTTGKAVDNSSSSAATDTSLADIKKKGEIIMYTNAEFPPFEYMKGENVAGVDVDIANAIAKDLGVKLTIKSVAFDTIIGSIKASKGDFGAAGMTVTPERSQEVDFSTKYVKSKQYIIVADKSEVATIEDLKGMKIGVQEGTTGDFTISDALDKDKKGVLAGTDAEILRYPNALDASMALKSGKIQAVVIDQLPAQNIATANDGLKAFELVFANGKNTEEEYAICVKKGNKTLLDAINKTIDKLIEDGSIDKFVLKHTSDATA